MVRYCGPLTAVPQRLLDRAADIIIAARRRFETPLRSSDVFTQMHWSHAPLPKTEVLLRHQTRDNLNTKLTLTI